MEDKLDKGYSSAPSFEETLKKAGFTDKTIKFFYDNDFNTLASLNLLMKKPGVLSELQLSLQQRLSLKKY